MLALSVYDGLWNIFHMKTFSMQFIIDVCVYIQLCVYAWKFRIDWIWMQTHTHTGYRHYMGENFRFHLLQCCWICMLYIWSVLWPCFCFPFTTIAIVAVVFVIAQLWIFMRLTFIFSIRCHYSHHIDIHKRSACGFTIVVDAPHLQQYKLDNIFMMMIITTMMMMMMMFLVNTLPSERRIKLI